MSKLYRQLSETGDSTCLITVESPVTEVPPKNIGQESLVLPVFDELFVECYLQAFLKARDAFTRNRTKDVKFRIQQLKQLEKCVNENFEAFVDVLKADLNKPRFEAVVTEIDFVLNDIKYQLNHVKQFSAPKYVKKGLPNILDSCFIKREPYGVVLIFSPWNYPVQLLMCPLAGAIAAGNCVIMKPSEISPKTSNLLAQLLPKYLDRDCFHVITGGPEEASRILNERFDLIFFTGATSIGKIVYNAASKFLTPVVLELGGKSPVWLDDTVANFELAVRRILWGKFINAGQTCIAPDYILCTRDVQDRFVAIATKILREFYDGDAKKSDSYCRIISEKHFERLERIINNTKGKIVLGGEMDKEKLYVSPTIITDVDHSDTLMKDEIFGPLLPIVNVNTPDEAIEFVKRGEKPLTFYVYTGKRSISDKILEETSSGSVAVNECLLQMTVHELPFGGVGHSGIGRYHGPHSFETFSHPKSVLIKNFNPLIEFVSRCRYPPYTDGKLKIMRLLTRPSFLDDIDLTKTFCYTFTFVLGIALTVLFYSIK